MSRKARYVYQVLFLVSLLNETLANAKLQRHKIFRGTCTSNRSQEILKSLCMLFSEMDCTLKETGYIQKKKRIKIALVKNSDCTNKKRGLYTKRKKRLHNYAFLERCVFGLNVSVPFSRDIGKIHEDLLNKHCYTHQSFPKSRFPFV
ncbi:hypothetical protein BD560DRAFT_468809 [Blakeslea trispora]|nr:hypothetical protein BD560DRAFT_468809 [Blakeslea trispora]